MKDLANRLHTLQAISPVSVAANGATVSAIIDRAGYDSVMFSIATGVMGAAGVFAVTMDEGNAANLSDASAVAAADLGGTTYALAGFTQANANVTRKLAYTGGKRYVRLTITLSGNTGAHLIAAVAVLGDAVNSPTANPPQ
jgi:hypothetical protein